MNKFNLVCTNLSLARERSYLYKNGSRYAREVLVINCLESKRIGSRITLSEIELCTYLSPC